MDPEDKLLISQRLDSLTMARYDRFKMLNSDDGRLMNALFNDQNYVITNIDANDLGRQLYILAGDVQHTDIAGVVTGAPSAVAPTERVALYQLRRLYPERRLSALPATCPAEKYDAHGRQCDETL